MMMMVMMAVPLGGRGDESVRRGSPDTARLTGHTDIVVMMGETLMALKTFAIAGSVMRIGSPGHGADTGRGVALTVTVMTVALTLKVLVVGGGPMFNKVLAAVRGGGRTQGISGTHSRLGAHLMMTMMIMIKNFTIRKRGPAR